VRFLTLAPLLACTSNLEETSDTEVSTCVAFPRALDGTMMVRGTERTYEISLPSDFDPEKSYPLVFAIHGLGGSGALARAYFGFAATLHEQAIVIYPDGLSSSAWGGTTGWDLTAGGDDMAFYDKLHQQATEQLCADPDRVYASGHSFGGYMSNAIGCHREDIVAAIAPVAGGPSWASCDSSVPALLIHGTQDDVVPLSEGLDALASWSDANSCSATTPPDTADLCIDMPDCDKAVRWCEHPGKHEWPAFAAREITAFFELEAE